MHASLFGQSLKDWEVFDGRQYPGLGPIREPPKQTASSGHGWQSPGSF